MSSAQAHDRHAIRAHDLDMIRNEIGDICARVAAHANAAMVHADAACDRGLAFELRCAAASVMSAAALIEHLHPSRQQQGGRAA